MGDYDYGDDYRFEIWTKNYADRTRRERITHEAKLDGFMDAGLWVPDTTRNLGPKEKRLAVQEVLTCGQCYSLVALGYIQEHREFHKGRK